MEAIESTAMDLILERVDHGIQDNDHRELFAYETNGELVHCGTGAPVTDQDLDMADLVLIYPK